MVEIDDDRTFLESFDVEYLDSFWRISFGIVSYGLPLFFKLMCNKCVSHVPDLQYKLTVSK